MEEHERKMDEWKKKRDIGYECVMHTFKLVTETIEEAQEELMTKSELYDCSKSARRLYAKFKDICHS